MKAHQTLFGVFNRFMLIKKECRYNVIKKHNISELTLKQIEYLKLFDRRENVTISQLAMELGLSKPTVTEMVKKFIRLDCIQKEQCRHDARVYYLYLTEKGKMIARLEQIADDHFVKRVESSLNKEEINLLIEILLKIV
ncbi:MAG: MarR family winged helix-turn-helix transcriptional regulator [Atribacterota bacterium]|nr:MarR family winged helix-turn-helix transcriptional regulator [Atribacterota bacterium]MDD4288802.1 MarR family winged helix-turn-helix transcriptional regulator [Atribacterota bacterium]